MNNCIYKKSSNNECRYLLGQFDKNIQKKMLVCIGINPSTAETNNLDEIENSKHTKINIESIKHLLTNYDCEILAAWGTLILKRDYLKDCLKDIYKNCPKDTKWICFW